ncbi:MAG TPA: anthrone oxygenase family protein [Hyphomicrobiaceae bacterium]|nr:anthrone oxygenase family protein [Hyphomicrobiaceae bacterium]
MLDAVLPVLRIATAVACGLMAGLFFAFSNTVMAALAARPPAEGMAAMQAINRVILNPAFLTIFLITPLACAIVAGTSLWRWSEPGAVWLILGSVLYIAGVFVVTVLANVPMNNALDAVHASVPQAAAHWSQFLVDWTRWNHVRTGTSILAAALLTIGIYLSGRA